MLGLKRGKIQGKRSEHTWELREGHCQTPRTTTISKSPTKSHSKNIKIKSAMPRDFIQQRYIDNTKRISARARTRIRNFARTKYCVVFFVCCVVHVVVRSCAGVLFTSCHGLGCNDAFSNPCKSWSLFSAWASMILES